MRFTLTYDGELPSSGNSSKKVQEKWNIRKQFDPQLKELWSSHPDLINSVKRGRFTIPKKGSYWTIEDHHLNESEGDGRIDDGSPDQINLINPITRSGKQFLPLVRTSLALKCNLKVLFLRREPPGKVYQGGDLDNRIKTLFDSLSVPPNEQVVPDEEVVSPICCLVEDDSLITGINVQSERLLQSGSDKTVRLIIEVNITVSQARSYNMPFLGS